MDQRAVVVDMDTCEAARDATVEEVAALEGPARSLGIHNLRPATFPPPTAATRFLVGSAAEGGGVDYLIKIHTDPVRRERELLAVSVLGEGARDRFILCGTPLASPKKQESSSVSCPGCQPPITGFATPYYPYSLEMLTDRFAELDTQEREGVALLMMLRLSAAVRYSHRRGLLHCDIKPDNIFVDERGERLADWDLCRRLDDASVRADLKAGYGSPRYRVVLEDTWSVVMVDRVGLVMVVLEILGYLKLWDVRVAVVSLQTVVDAASRIDDELLRDSVRRFCKIKKVRPPPPGRAEVNVDRQ